MSTHHHHAPLTCSRGWWARTGPGAAPGTCPAPRRTVPCARPSHTSSARLRWWGWVPQRGRRQQPHRKQKIQKTAFCLYHSHCLSFSPQHRCALVRNNCRAHPFPSSPPSPSLRFPPFPCPSLPFNTSNALSLSPSPHPPTFSRSCPHPLPLLRSNPHPPTLSTLYTLPPEMDVIWSK